MLLPVRIDLLLAAGWAVAALLATLLGVDNAVVRSVLAGPLVLVLPGYSLTLALFPRGTRHRAEQVLLTLGLSLAAIALGGLVLELAPGQLGAGSWAVFLTGVTLACCAVALVRRTHAGVAEHTPADRVRLTPAQGAMVGLASLIVVGCIWLARSPAPQQPNQAYSVLWAVPEAGMGNRVRVGVISGERETADFIVRVLQGGREMQDFPIQLPPTGTWETELALSSQTDQTMEIQLSRAEDPDVVYRRVTVRNGS